MMDYKKICEECVEYANDLCRAWEHLYERSLNYGEQIESPYDVITLDDIDGGFKSINEICHDILLYERAISISWLLEFWRFLHDTSELIRAFCYIIGEPYKCEYLQYYKKTFWLLNPISDKYAFTLREMWWVVNEYDHWIEKYGCRENVEKSVKDWYMFGHKINLLHWLMGAREL